MAKKLFSRKPVDYIHYLFLTGILFGGYYLGDLLFQTKFQELWLMFVWFFGVLAAGDQIYHYFFD